MREALSMRSESFIVSEMLQRMEQQNQLLRPAAVEVAAALCKDEYPTALEAAADLHRVLGSFVATTEALQEHVIARDGMGDLGESLDELALRARTLVLRAQLELLREELRETGAHARARDWFVGRFQGIADVDAYIRERLDRIHALWLPYRRDQPQQDGMTDPERASLYRTMVRVAQRQLQALCDDPDLAEFLASGLAATDLVEIHLACRQIVTVLGLPSNGPHVRGSLRRRRRGAAIHNHSVPSAAHGTPSPGKRTTDG
jgi:hypothetical protein